jgi:hypothetical protein
MAVTDVTGTEEGVAEAVPADVGCVGAAAAHAARAAEQAAAIRSALMMEGAHHTRGGVRCANRPHRPHVSSFGPSSELARDEAARGGPRFAQHQRDCSATTSDS